jgi:hypothetical protein
MQAIDTVLLRQSVQSCDKIWTKKNQKKSEKSKEKHFG